MFYLLKVLKRDKTATDDSLRNEQLREDFAPLLEKSKTTLSPLKRWMQTHPSLSFGLLMGILILNFLVLVFFTNAYQTSSADTLKALDKAAASVKNTGGVHASIGQIISDYDGYKNVKAMQDTVQLLLSKPHLTREDSLTFIRIVEDIQQKKN